MATLLADMVLELTEEQRAFKESIERFARETVAPQAARIDESGEFPIDLIRASVPHGLAGVTMEPSWSLIEFALRVSLSPAIPSHVNTRSLVPEYQRSLANSNRGRITGPGIEFIAFGTT